MHLLNRAPRPLSSSHSFGCRSIASITRAAPEQLTVAFDVALGVLPLVQLRFAVLLLQLWSEALVRCVALLLRRVMRRDAGAVGRTSRQRFAVPQDVLN